MLNISINPIVLCGGGGTRLWPLSRQSYPKQYVPLIRGQSLFELTLLRVKNMLPPLVVANEAHRFVVRDLSDKVLSTTATQFLLEPSGKNTAAAIALAMHRYKDQPNELLLFLPSDHYIDDLNAFNLAIKSGISAAQSGYIVTFGIKPTYPSTSYGYIKKGLSLDKFISMARGFEVDCFSEKPSLSVAKDMYSSGKHLWNSGIFLCKVATLFDAYVECANDIFKSTENAIFKSTVDGRFIRPCSEDFMGIRSESFDYAVLEKYNKIAVVPMDGGWSDLGSWRELSKLTVPDKCDNRVTGLGLAINSKNTYIKAGNRLVVVLGVDDLMVVDTPDALLVTSKDCDDNSIKNLVANLREMRLAQATENRKIVRPWGCFESIDAGDSFQVKRISVKPGASLSLQAHNYRAEHWIVVKGVAKVTCDEKVFLLTKNQSTYIPIGAKHRLENPTEEKLEMIEVQSGSYLGEDDITRFEDVYGRE